jgi:hypothetical protein
VPNLKLSLLKNFIILLKLYIHNESNYFYILMILNNIILWNLSNCIVYLNNETICYYQWLYNINDTSYYNFYLKWVKLKLCLTTNSLYLGSLFFFARVRCPEKPTNGSERFIPDTLVGAKRSRIGRTSSAIINATTAA